MEKMIFYYPDFVEIRPTTLQEQILLRAEEGDIPAMLLFARMYAKATALRKTQGLLNNGLVERFPFLRQINYGCTRNKQNIVSAN